MRVKVSATGLYAHPDVLVVYGDAVFENAHRDTLLNPTVIIEVLSDSTEENDRVHKFEHYHEIESLKEYLLVSQNSYNVEHYVRLPNDQWYLYELKNYHDHFHLEAIMANLAMSEIYFKVNVPH
jgi:Uma2 family endonuclease